ncbi:MAG: hypothetical protein KI790_07595, partial [Cyclobacteriaceae bacterium]|nr:hypothetical protein [Cyclobacteriaceae bacterium HetDA_MAG_MS6]
MIKFTVKVKSLGIAIFCVGVITGCSSVKRVVVRKDIERIIQTSPVFSSQFTGFTLFDPSSGKY